MNGPRPTPRQLFTGAVAIWPLAVVVRRPTSSPRLLGEAFGTTPVVIGVVQFAWLALWFLEQHW
jgi:hypothetical protein